MHAQSSHHETDPIMNTSTQLGGWLILIIIYMRVVYPISAVAGHFALYGHVRINGLWMGYVWIDLFGLIVMSVLAQFAGYRLHSRRVDASKTFAMYTLMIVGPGWQLIDSFILLLLRLVDKLNLGMV